MEYVKKVIGKGKRGKWVEEKGLTNYGFVIL